MNKDSSRSSSSSAAEAPEDLDVLLIGGVPLNEPVARYGTICYEYESGSLSGSF